MQLFFYANRHGNLFLFSRSHPSNSDITTMPFSMSITATTDETVPKLIYEWSLTRPDDRTVYSDAMLSTKPWVRFNPDKNNLTIVPELGTADNDDDKVRDVVGIYRVNISHEYDYVVVAFEINTNFEQVTSK